MMTVFFMVEPHSTVKLVLSKRGARMMFAGGIGMLEGDNSGFA